MFLPVRCSRPEGNAAGGQMPHMLCNDLRRDTACEALPVSTISRDANSLHNEAIMQLQQELASAILGCHTAMQLGSACGHMQPCQLLSPSLGHLQQVVQFAICYVQWVGDS